MQNQIERSNTAQFSVTYEAPIDTTTRSEALAERVSQDTAQQFDNQKEDKSLFEPVTENPYYLSFACLLIPRFDNHRLTGDVVDCLREWMHQICISFGWKLDYISLQPGYMQWLVSVPVSVSPAQIIRTVRKQTSKYIFNDFPAYTSQNIGRDFWAPGHLVVVGRQLHPKRLVQEFIRLTRQQQAAGTFSQDSK